MEKKIFGLSILTLMLLLGYITFPGEVERNRFEKYETRMELTNLEETAKEKPQVKEVIEVKVKELSKPLYAIG